VIKDASGGKLYKVKVRSDGVMKLKRASGETLYKLKPQDYGYKVKDGAGGTVSKVKRDGDALKLKRDDGTLLYELRGVADARAGAWFALQELSLAERAALFVFFSELYR
jgi:hypothetical protein